MNQEERSNMSKQEISNNKQTKKIVIEALREVFNESDNPPQMRVLIRRIPILCTNIEAMHKKLNNIDSNLEIHIKDFEEHKEESNQRRPLEVIVQKIVFGGIGLILTAVLLALLGKIFSVY